MWIMQVPPVLIKVTFLSDHRVWEILLLPHEKISYSLEVGGKISQDSWGTVLYQPANVIILFFFVSRELYKDLWMVVTGLHDLTEEEYRQVLLRSA